MCQVNAGERRKYSEEGSLLKVIFHRGLYLDSRPVLPKNLSTNTINQTFCSLHSGMCKGGGPAMNRVGLAANGYKSGELESVKFFCRRRPILIAYDNQYQI